MSLEDLMRKYRESIPSKLEQIARLIDEYEHSPSKENLAALKLAVHKLAGSAGTYGYPEASRLCKNLESQIDKGESRLPLSLFYQQLTRSFSQTTH